MNFTKISGASVLFAAVVLSLGSCTEKKPAGISFETVTKGAMFELEGSAKIFNQDKDIVFSDSVSLIMPVELGDCDVASLRDKIMSLALDTAGIPLNDAVDLWLETTAAETEYKPKRITDSDAAGNGLYSGYGNVNGYIVNMTPDLLVYCVSSYFYTPGAAHGMYGSNYINYSMIGTGKILVLSDIFTEKGIQALPERIAEQAEAMSDLIGTTQITELPSNGNYYISSEGEIVFSYLPYEVASYAQGSIDIPFYPYELAEYMTPFGLEMFNLDSLE